MGRRGPARTPTPDLKLAGSREAVKREKTEPKFVAGVGRCPSWLDDCSKVEWRRLSKKLSDAGVIQQIDGNALARYCRLWTRWRIVEGLDRSGGGICTDTGEANKLAIQLTKLEAEFGMTPASRSRVIAMPKTKTSKKDRFFKKQA